MKKIKPKKLVADEQVLQLMARVLYLNTSLVDGKCYEHTQEQFITETKKVREGHLPNFVTRNVFGYFNDNKAYVRYSEFNVKAVLKNGIRIVYDKRSYMSLTFKLDTGRLIYRESVSGKAKIRTLTTHHKSVHGTLITTHNTNQLIKGLTKHYYGEGWYNGIECKHSFEDIHMSHCNRKEFMKRRFKKVFDPRFLYIKDDFVLEHYNEDELRSIAAFCFNFNGETVYLGNNSDYLVTYYVHRYNVSQHSANDYLQMCRERQLKPKIYFENGEHFENNHIEMSLIAQGPNVVYQFANNIPGYITTENINLMLITNSVDLLKEGVKQSHCVASYNSNIQSGYYLVYIGIINNERVTVGLSANSYSKSEHYILSQIYKKANMSVSNETRNILTLYLDKHPIELPPKLKRPVTTAGAYIFNQQGIQAGPGLLAQIDPPF